MKVELLSDLHVVRVNSPEIYQDPAFKEWFFNRPDWETPIGKVKPPPIASWHGQDPEFHENSDIFFAIELIGGDEAEGTGAEDDMPEHIWDKLTQYAWDAVKELDSVHIYVEVLVWLSNQPE